MARKKEPLNMEAFGYQPAYWPYEDEFEFPILEQQSRFLRAYQSTREYSGAFARALYRTICEAYGLVPQYTLGHGAVVIDFLKSASRASITQAEEEARKNVL